MENTYNFTIRDLTNEAQEIKTKKEKIEKEEKEFFEYFSNKSHDILQSINSYLGHLHQELRKLNFNIRVGFASLEIHITTNESFLIINNKVYYYKPSFNTFVTQDDNGELHKLEENPEDMGELLEDWSYVKKSLEERIQNKYEIEKTNLQKRENNLKHFDLILKNFKI